MYRVGRQGESQAREVQLRRGIVLRCIVVHVVHGWELVARMGSAVSALGAFWADFCSPPETVE